MNMTTPTPIPVHIVPHHLTLSPSLNACARGSVEKLSHFAHDALAAHMVLRRHHGTTEGKRFSASLRLALPGRDLHATATHADMYVAIELMTRKLARRSRRRKTRRVRSRSLSACRMVR